MNKEQKIEYVDNALSKLRLSEKGSYLLQDPARVVFTEGITRTGKSYLLGIKFFKQIFLAPGDQTEFYFCAVSLDRIRQMLINDNNSFYNMFKEVCNYKKGEYMIEIQGVHGIKHLYFIGYSLASSWTKIRGANISGILLEEINLAHDTFLNEAFGRGLALPWSVVYCNSNGDDPEKDVYTKHLNHCRPLPMYVEELIKNDETNKIYSQLLSVPKSKNWRYYHFTFRDNPILTKERIESIKSGFQPGSYEWLTMIEGGRGVREGAIFADVMTHENNVTPYQTVFQDYHFIKYTIGLDVGHTDYTVFTLNGFTGNYNDQVVIDILKINKAGTTKIWDVFYKWYEQYQRMRLDIYGVFIDYGGGGSILTTELEPKFRSMGIRVGQLHKYTIKQRCIIGNKLLGAGRLKFTDKAIDGYKAFAAAVYTKDRSKTDVRQWGLHTHKDIVDSVEYGMSPFVKRMLPIKF